VFSIGPAAAPGTPGPPPLPSPQPGSIQAACTRPPARQPQIAIPSLYIYAPRLPARAAAWQSGNGSLARLAMNRAEADHPGLTTGLASKIPSSLMS
jgi:hypothetical protein